MASNNKRTSKKSAAQRKGKAGNTASPSKTAATQTKKRSASQASSQAANKAAANSTVSAKSAKATPAKQHAASKNTSQSARKTTVQAKQNSAVKSQSTNTASTKSANVQRQQVAVAPAKKGNGVAWLALLCGLGGLATGGYAYYQITLNQQQTGGAVSALGGQVEGLVTSQEMVKADLTQATDRLDKADTRIDEVEKSFSEQLSAVDSNVTKSAATVATLQSQSSALADQSAALEEQSKKLQASNQQWFDESQESATTLFNEKLANSKEAFTQYETELGGKVEQWKYAEIRSLLTSVQNNLGLTGDAPRAAEGLALVDDSLGALNDERFKSVREQLSENITELKAIKPIDFKGMNQQLTDLGAQVEDLPYLQDRLIRENDALPEKTAEAEPEVQSDDAASDSSGEAVELSAAQRMKAAGKSLFSDLGSMMKVQKVENKPLVSMDSKAKFMVDESVRLNLKAAKLAMLKKDQSVYQAQLDEAVATANKHFDPEAAEVKKWLQGIADLKPIDFDVSVPDISNLRTLFDSAVAKGN